MLIFKRPQFLLDLAQELNWLKDKAGTNVAERWYQELLVTIEELKQHPHLGRKRPDLKPEGIRSWRVKRFSHWLVWVVQHSWPFAVAKPEISIAGDEVTSIKLSFTNHALLIKSGVF